MGIFKKIIQQQRERAAKAVAVGSVTREVHKELDNKSLAYVSKVVRGLIPTYGLANVRKRVIAGIESDLRRGVKRHPDATVDSLIAEALRTPDYMALLSDLGMGEDHLRLMAQEALTHEG